MYPRSQQQQRPQQRNRSLANEPLLSRRRTAMPIDRRDLEAEVLQRRHHHHHHLHNPHQHERRQRDSSFAGSESHSIHLESAPWLGRQRQQQQSQPQSQQVPRNTTPHIRRDTTHQHQAQPEEPQLKHHESHATKGNSSQFTHATSHSTPCLADSMMSDATRSLLYGKAVKMSHTMVRRAHQMIKNIERSRTLANGSRRQRNMEIDGYRFVSLSKGVAVYEDATYIRLENKVARPRFVGVSAVKATLDEFIDVFGRNNELAFSHLNPDMTSCRQMHTISEEADRRIGVKWMTMQPTWAGSLARRRDFVILECEENYSLANSASSSSGNKDRRGWVQMMHSVQLPWCPPMEKASNIVRGSMYQTGMVVLESEASPKWLHVFSVVEVDMKGNIADRAQHTNALKRLECLEAVGSTLVKQRLQRMSLLRTKQFNAAKPPKESHCAVCTQRLGLVSLRLHHYCRKCSASVCGRCSRNWQLDPTTKRKTRVCGMCIMAIRPSKIDSSNNTYKDDEVTQGITSMQRAIQVSMSQQQDDDELHNYRVQTLTEDLPGSGSSNSSDVNYFRHDSNLQFAPGNLNRANTMPIAAMAASIRQTQTQAQHQDRVSRYFDLPMDARELTHFSEDDDTSCAASDSADTIYPFSDRGGQQMEFDDSGYSVFREASSRQSRSSRTVVTEDDEEESQREEVSRSAQRTRTNSTYQQHSQSNGNKSKRHEIHL